MGRQGPLYGVMRAILLVWLAVACSGDGFGSAAKAHDSGAPSAREAGAPTAPQDADADTLRFPDAQVDAITADAMDAEPRTDAAPEQWDADAPTDAALPDAEAGPIECAPGSKVCPSCDQNDERCCVEQAPWNGCGDPNCAPCSNPAPAHGVQACRGSECSFRCIEPYADDGNGGCELYQCQGGLQMLCGGSCKSCGAEIEQSCCTISGACRSIYLTGEQEQCVSFY